jgi:hypothetical protein
MEIVDDYYWEINQAQLYDSTKEPSDFPLGSAFERLGTAIANPVGRGITDQVRSGVAWQRFAGGRAEA